MGGNHAQTTLRKRPPENAAHHLRTNDACVWTFAPSPAGIGLQKESEGGPIQLIAYLTSNLVSYSVTVKSQIRWFFRA
jgi:hypothetical protein